MTQRHVVILGGTGFVGRHLVARLLSGGDRITVLSRGVDARKRAMKPQGASLIEGDVSDADFLAAVLDDADAAINLVGILNEKGDNGRGFEHVFVGITDALIEAMTRMGVRRLLQMSALNAGRGDSHYLQSRGRAEQHVRASGLDWTLFRPSVIAGPGDGLFCRFDGLLKFAPALPIGGAGARFQPVWVGDVVDAFAKALDEPRSIGQSYDLVGPDVLTLKQIVKLAARGRGRHRIVIGLPPALGKLQAEIGEWLPGKPISRDNWRSLQLDSVSLEDGLRRLGVTPTAVEPKLAEILAGC
ncbi:complex I NDUFA9 subunit family protein [Lysobacter sp. MMG2]|uniref:complex I NDUFA9 subunit family protein n=1 Tax=Lysobacter sp. MMG2 TaxID=2801338 RepID=UPI001C21DCE8|nr:complex I NDUFA9 subunit family protein [Lysobacter sp. MMG2]MBU8977432.1 complex I NDUFA9 subunit family protein [Lysobacter sp. MMG2]